ncbi:MAG: acyltransferase family protein [Cytophaga sp.]|uniref:acyltransferase family protein n=1 Tax=Cytophaga sp. TaxID=29535 RepID=UPI003F811FA5
MLQKLNVFKVVNNPDRISSVDFFRGIAVLAVVLFHFKGTLPFGYLGVEIFFVISGLLVGGLLTKDLTNQKKIVFFEFFLKRGFKIWPSYYMFLLLGTGVAVLFYSQSHPDQIIPLWDLKRYLFFYQNYTGGPFHWSFDHVWTLCVEEHFYILLPILYIFIQKVFPVEKQKQALFLFVTGVIVSGIILKHCSYFFTNSKDVIASTHNRIDALGWGVLLNLIVTFYGDKIKNKKVQVWATCLGVLIFAAAIIGSVYSNESLFYKMYLHTIIPFAFALVLLGVYYIDFSSIKFIQVIAYYSYNWYLWHPVFVFFIHDRLGATWLGVLSYLAITFSAAVLSTILIEEPFLKRRKKVIDRIFH